MHSGALVICQHFGLAQPTVPNPRVTVSGQPTVAITSPYTVSNCILGLLGVPPCVTAQYVTAATRVTSNGQPLLLFDSQAVCAPTGASLIPLLTQIRVTGT